MPETLYVLRIRRPDEIEPGVLAEIEADADTQDQTLDAKVARWLGGSMADAESAISAWLPEGWYASIEDAN